MVDSGSMNLMSHRVSSDSFLENLKFLDFPMENIEGDVYEKEQEEEEEELEGVDWNAKLQSALGPIPVDFLSRCLNENIANGGSELNLNNSGRGTDEGGSRLTKSSHLIQDTSTMNKSERVQPLSPISVLEDNNSRMLATHIPRRARTKRSRPFGNKIWTSTVLERDFIKKKRKIPEKKTTTSSGTPKRCSHCQVTQTPQWREGPMGPKTLCNACGVRYRSGRLFPEYRPMASPGFVPSLHSNSHRKVLEMRNKGGNMNLAITGAGTDSATVPPRRRVMKAPPVYERENSPPPEFIPMSDYLLDCVLGSEVFNY